MKYGVAQPTPTDPKSLNRNGVQVVVGSNPTGPTKSINGFPAIYNPLDLSERIEEHVHEVLISPLQPGGIPRYPIGNPADVEVAARMVRCNPRSSRRGPDRDVPSFRIQHESDMGRLASAFNVVVMTVPLQRDGFDLVKCWGDINELLKRVEN